MNKRMCAEMKTCAPGQVKTDCVCVGGFSQEILAESSTIAPCTSQPQEPPAAPFHPAGREGRRDKAAFP